MCYHFDFIFCTFCVRLCMYEAWPSRACWVTTSSFISKGSILFLCLNLTFFSFHFLTTSSSLRVPRTDYSLPADIINVRLKGIYSFTQEYVYPLSDCMYIMCLNCSVFPAVKRERYLYPVFFFPFFSLCKLVSHFNFS